MWAERFISSLFIFYHWNKVLLFPLRVVSAVQLCTFNDCLRCFCWMLATDSSLGQDLCLQLIHVPTFTKVFLFTLRKNCWIVYWHDPKGFQQCSTLLPFINVPANILILCHLCMPCVLHVDDDYITCSWPDFHTRKWWGWLCSYRLEGRQATDHSSSLRFNIWTGISFHTC